MATRRQFIKAGVVTSLLLAGATPVLAPLWRPPEWPAPGLRWLRAGDAAIVAALAPVMLGVPDVPRADVTRGVDVAIASLPPVVQAEVRQLFVLLGHPLGRRWLAGVRPDWEHATAAELSGFLQRWRVNRFLLMRSAYQALHALIGAAWYGSPASWGAIGYRQPERIMEYMR